MGLSSAWFVWVVLVHNMYALLVVHSLFLAVVLQRIYGFLQFTVCMCAAVVHTLRMGTCNAS